MAAIAEVTEGEGISSSPRTSAGLVLDQKMMVIMNIPSSSPSPLSRKAVTHEHIVKIAARAFQRRGYDGIGIAEIMKEAGLTHGGFYAHFASREALLVEATDRAGAEVVSAWRRTADAAQPGRALESLVRDYLSPEHFGKAELGCPIAALGSELPRQSPKVRRASTRRIKEMIDLVACQAPDIGQREAYKRALGIMSTMVGAVLIARAVDDAELAAELLEVALKHLAPASA